VSCWKMPPSAYHCGKLRSGAGIRGSSTTVRTGGYATVVIVDAIIYAMALSVSGSSVTDLTYAAPV